ncbi:MAG: phosphate acyltransferase PlsX [Candidatus Sumerlaeia bacterium]
MYMTRRSFSRDYRIAVDAMGGDHAPLNPVEGTLMAGRDLPGELILVGPKKKISRLLALLRRVQKRTRATITIVDAPETVSMNEPPAQAVKKLNSSIAVAARLVREQRADALVSAGNTGAVFGVSLLTLRKIPTVLRPAITALLPTKSKKPVVLLDVGANVDCKPQHLLQFAMMGTVFAREVLERANPRVGLLNIGEEEGKGNEQVKQTFDLLKKAPLNFGGNAEGKDILTGDFDVVVCDGFVGNVILKFGEGAADLVFSGIRHGIRRKPYTLPGAVLMGPVFRRFKREVDYSEYGGAPLLGLNGSVIIGHGRSTPKAIKNAILAATAMIDHQLNAHLRRDMETLAAWFKSLTPAAPSPPTPPYPNSNLISMVNEG